MVILRLNYVGDHVDSSQMTNLTCTKPIALHLPAPLVWPPPQPPLRVCLSHWFSLYFDISSSCDGQTKVTGNVYNTVWIFFMKSNYANHDLSGFHCMFYELVLVFHFVTIYAQIQPLRRNLSIKSVHSVCHNILASYCCQVF